MKIKIKNYNDLIIRDAFVQQSQIGNSLSLFINTYQKNCAPDAYESGGDEFGVIYYDQDENGGLGARVLFIAETEEERELLSCLHFESHCKDQLWIIFLKEQVYK
jgi:hypothetical protein